MSAMDDFLKDLAEEAKPWAKLWLPVFKRWGHERLADWILASHENWIEAYSVLVGDMDTDERIAELKIHRASLERLNRDNAAFVARQREILYAIFAKAIALIPNL